MSSACSWCVFVLIHDRKFAWGHDDLAPLSNGLLSIFEGFDPGS